MFGVGRVLGGGLDLNLGDGVHEAFGRQGGTVRHAERQAVDRFADDIGLVAGAELGLEVLALAHLGRAFVGRGRDDAVLEGQRDEDLVVAGGRLVFAGGGVGTILVRSGGHSRRAAAHGRRCRDAGGARRR